MLTVKIKDWLLLLLLLRLVEAFGSTRRRRQLNAREEGTVRVEKLGDSADALQAIMGKVVTDAEAQGITKEKVWFGGEEV